MINGLKELKLLDEAEIKELDRIGAEAYMIGGSEFEKKAKKDYLQAEQDRFKDNFRRTKEFVAQAEMLKSMNKASQK